MLDAALALIVDEGFGAVTMEAVARRADLAKTVVYNAYPNRDALLGALLEREATRALATFADALPDAPAPEDPLAAPLAWVRAVVAAITADPTPWRLILLPPDETPREVRDAVDAGRALVLQHVRGLVAEVVAQRPALGRIDPDLLPRALLAACEEGARLLLARPDEYDARRVVRFAEDLLQALVR